MTQGFAETVKHLRKMDFPKCAREALVQIEQLSMVNTQQARGAAAQHKLIMELTDEFIFCKRRLRAIQEMQLVDILVNYFSYPGSSEVVKNTVFMTLFPTGGGTSKMGVLAKLLSMALAIKCFPVLNCAGLWMQQQGCQSQLSLQVAEAVVKDYFLLLPNSASWLTHLPTSSSVFTANFMVAVATLYRPGEGSNPPPLLVETITSWIIDNRQLCIAALITQQQSALPRGSILMPPTSPVVYLFRWSILLPLLDDDSKHEKTYAELHLGLLQTLLEASSQRLNVVPVKPLEMLVEALLTIEQKEAHPEERLRDAVDRLAMAVQTSVATNCLQGNTGELFRLLAQLPNTRLLTMVLCHT